MNIKNESDFRFDQLSAFIRRVAAEELDAAQAANLTIVVRSRSQKAARKHPNVYYTRDTRTILLTLPYVVTNCKMRIARYIAWSMAIHRGLKRRELGPRYQHGDAARVFWEWALNTPLSRKTDERSSTLEQKRFKELQTAEKAVKNWERKKKLATTKLAQWKRQANTIRKRMEKSKQLSSTLEDEGEGFKGLALEAVRRTGEVRV